jgi:ferrous iron transport protein A
LQGLESAGEVDMTLNELEIGKSAKIVAVHGRGALRDRLLDMGLTPRTMVMIRKTAPFGDPIELTIRSYELTLRIADAKSIEVERLD